MQNFKKMVCALAMSGVGIMALANPENAFSQTAVTVAIDPNGVTLENSFRPNEQLVVENGQVKSVPRGSAPPAVWIFELQSGGHYRIRNKADGTYLNLESEFPQSTNVPINYASAWWSLIPTGRGTYRIKNNFFDKFLNTESGKFEASLGQQVPSNYATSWWSFKPATPQTTASAPSAQPSQRAFPDDNPFTKRRPIDLKCGPIRTCWVLVRQLLVQKRTEISDDEVYALANTVTPPFAGTRYPKPWVEARERLNISFIEWFYSDEVTISTVVAMNQEKPHMKQWDICHKQQLSSPIQFQFYESDKNTASLDDDSGPDRDDLIGNVIIGNQLQQQDYAQVFEPEGGGKYTLVYELADSEANLKPCVPSLPRDPERNPEAVAGPKPAGGSGGSGGGSSRTSEVQYKCQEWATRGIGGGVPETTQVSIVYALTYGLCVANGGPL